MTPFGGDWLSPSFQHQDICIIFLLITVQDSACIDCIAFYSIPNQSPPPCSCKQAASSVPGTGLQSFTIIIGKKKDFSVKKGPKKDHFSSLVLKRTKSLIKDLYTSTEFVAV